MRRRDFIAIFGGAAAMPVVARANKFLAEDNTTVLSGRTYLAADTSGSKAIGA